jgi:hypothetical protein
MYIISFRKFKERCMDQGTSTENPEGKIYCGNLDSDDGPCSEKNCPYLKGLKKVKQ